MSSPPSDTREFVDLVTRARLATAAAELALMLAAARSQLARDLIGEDLVMVLQAQHRQGPGTKRLN